MNMRVFYLLTAAILLVFPLFAQVGPIRVACVGNSITNGGNAGTQTYPAQLSALLGSHFDVRNFGIGGRTLLRKGDYPYWNEPMFYTVQDFDPQILIICLGTNDSKPWNWVYKDDFYTDYMDFVSAFRQSRRHPQIYVCFPPPVFIDGYGITNSVIRDEIIPLLDSVRVTAKTLSINFHQLMLGDSVHFPDGIHPDATGYSIMAQIVRDSIVNSPGGFARYFLARSPSFEQGESDMLYWETSPGSDVTINGTPVNQTDSMLVTPAGTTTYTLIAGGTVHSDTVPLTLQYYPPGKIKSFNVDFPMLDEGIGDSCLLSWTSSKGSSVSLDDVPVGADSSAFMAPPSTTTFTLTAAGDVTDTSTVTVQVLPSNQINRVLHRQTWASTSNHGYSPDAVVDGDTATKWVTQSFESQWLLTDLRKRCKVNKIVLTWGDNYATRYRVGISQDSAAWSLLWSNLAGTGGTETREGLNGTARYLKVYLDKRFSTDSGYVLREMTVYGMPLTGNAVGEFNGGVPGRFALYQNYPNPFNPETNIRYQISDSRFVRLVVYDILGREVAALVDGVRPAGGYKVTWDASRFTTGVYFCTLVAGAFVQTIRMIVVR